MSFMERSGFVENRDASTHVLTDAMYFAMTTFVTGPDGPPVLKSHSASDIASSRSAVLL